MIFSLEGKKKRNLYKIFVSLSDFFFEIFQP